MSAHSEPQPEARCVHATECGACPLIDRPYDEQRRFKQARVATALVRFGVEVAPSGAGIQAAKGITGYRRRAKLVVARHSSGEVVVGLFRRGDNQRVVDIPHCQVLSPPLVALVSELRELLNDIPPDLACVLAPAVDEVGVLRGIDARELWQPAEPGRHQTGVLLTLLLAAERARPVDELRDAARALRQRLPIIVGVGVTLRFARRQHGASEFTVLSGVAESKDELGDGYQIVSHSSFIHVHREQARNLYEQVAELVMAACGQDEADRKVLDLYGGTGAIALSLARRGLSTTVVESYPPAAALAQHAAQAQRLAVEVVTGDVASVTKALAVADSCFAAVVANPPRRGLSPAAREAIASIGARRVVYVACDLDNLARDVHHLARLGYRLTGLCPIDMLPLTEEVEVVATLEGGTPPPPRVLCEADDLLAVAKPAHEPLQQQPEYPGSLVQRAGATFGEGEWITVLEIGAGASGVCLLARGEAAVQRWKTALADSGRLVYLVGARGVTPAKGAITRELRGEARTPQARTRYRRLAIGGGHSVLRVVPENRCVHQIRRHLAAIGHPVLGDARYGHPPTNRYFEEKHGLDRSFLHLVRVEIDHPRTGKRLLIEAPLAADLRAALVRASDESVLRFLQSKRALGDAGTRQREGPPSGPMSERSPLSMVEPEPDSSRPSFGGGPPSARSSGRALDLDEAPRTVRGELLTPDDE